KGSRVRQWGHSLSASGETIYPPTGSITFPPSTDGTMFLGAFDAGWEGHESALYKVMETPHGPLYCGFRRMFETVVDGTERTV
ncbi:hypothetical protein ACIRVM_47955, partial [Streptomyces chartreusis]